MANLKDVRGKFLFDLGQKWQKRNCLYGFFRAKTWVQVQVESKMAKKVFFIPAPPFCQLTLA